MNNRRVTRRLAPAFAPKRIEGETDAAGLRIAVICSRWNPTITDALLRSCLDSLAAHGASGEDVTVVKVPGAFELPASAALAARCERPDAIVVLGAILRGETTHHEVLAHAVSGALAILSATSAVPIGFGLLTCDTLEQAQRRVEKGAEAAEAAIELANLRRAFRRPRRAPAPRPAVRPLRRSHGGKER